MDTFKIVVDENGSPIADGAGNFTCAVTFDIAGTRLASVNAANNTDYTLPPLDPDGNAWTDATAKAFLTPQADADRLAWIENLSADEV